MRWRRRKNLQPAASPAGLWLGHLAFDIEGGEQVMGRMSVDVGEREVRFRFFGRDQGAFSRELARAWLQQPVGSLRTEWLSFTSHRSQLHLAIGAAPLKGFALPQDFVDQLRALI